MHIMLVGAVKHRCPCLFVRLSVEINLRNGVQDSAKVTISLQTTYEVICGLLNGTFADID